MKLKANYKRIVLLIRTLYKTQSVHGYILSTILFNIKHLPFKQAIYLPIFLRKPNVKGFHGKIIVPKILETGMIRLGDYLVSIYPDTGIHIDGNGIIEFKGRCSIGNGAYLSISENGVLILGDTFKATSGLKIVCHDYIKLGNNVLLGWDTKICDTDFHTIESLDGQNKSKLTAPILIEDYCWVAQNCTVLKGTYIPRHTIVASNSLVNKKYEISSFCLLAGTPAKTVRENVKWNR